MDDYYIVTGIFILLLNTVIDLSITFVMLGVILHIFLMDRQHRRRVEALLSEAECVCEKLEKLYGAIF